MSAYEMIGREKKAGRLALALRTAGISGELARGMDESQWLTVAQQAKCKPPSALTRGVVIEMLRESEHARL